MFKRLSAGEILFPFSFKYLEYYALYIPCFELKRDLLLTARRELNKTCYKSRRVTKCMLGPFRSLTFSDR